MGTHAGLTYSTWVGGYDLTGDSNAVNMTISYDPKIRTVYGNTAQNRLAGLEAVESTVNGFADFAAGAEDAALFPGLTTGQPVTHAFDEATLGSIAYFYYGKTFTYRLFDKIGDVVPFSLGASSSRVPSSLSVGAVRGQVLAIKQSVSATGAIGAGAQLGAVASGQFQYAVLHLFSAGTTVTVVLESAAASNFAGATTRATLGPLTTTGGTWATRVAGPIIDTWWRFRVTAITGTFSLAGASGAK